MSVRCLTPAVRLRHSALLLAPGARSRAPIADSDHVPRRAMTSCSSRGETKQWRRKPWQYQRWGFTHFMGYLDNTQKRMDDNSRLVVVEGPMAAGKDRLARRIADEFEMIYVPTPEPDWPLIADNNDNNNNNSCQLRQLNSQLSHYAQFVDLTEFWRCPRDDRLVRVCWDLFSYKYRQTLQALAHILNTGQGAVITNSIYSNSAYWHAMKQMGYLSNNDFEFLDIQERKQLPALLRPHLVVYVDQPVDTTLASIKKSGSAEERQSEVFNKKFVSHLVDYQKNKWLKSLRVHSQILLVDPADPLATEFVVEDIEKLNMDGDPLDRRRFRDWNRLGDNMSAIFRAVYTNYHYLILNENPRDKYRCRSLLLAPHEEEEITSAMVDNFGVDVINYKKPYVDYKNSIV